ncbi:hypothetical protein GGU10DRAFT_401438 [Lentinula aff. detonsa]|uniref:Ras-domain-containing protein n=1 Tax=Lentinula aff. detonsa TaxID=2804958 RepID=A0AA38NMS6_9AGAR|nr:hypothetical protein GGU10DRAFT_401438 [Lentinula aff. detonsa]
MHMSEYDYLFKLLLIGDSGVGKSCLLLTHTLHPATSHPVARQQTSRALDSFAAIPPRATPICHPPGRSTPNEYISRLAWPCWTPSKANESGIDSFVLERPESPQTSLE